MLTTACFCSKIRRSSRLLLRLYDEGLAPTGLTTMQFAALRSIERLGGAPRLSELARETGYDRTAMWRTLQPLAREGLVELGGEARKAAPVRLTETGHSRAAAALPYWDAVQARIDKALGPDALALFNALDKVEALAA